MLHEARTIGRRKKRKHRRTANAPVDAQEQVANDDQSPNWSQALIDCHKPDHDSKVERLLDHDMGDLHPWWDEESWKKLWNYSTSSLGVHGEPSASNYYIWYQRPSFVRLTGTSMTKVLKVVSDISYT